nr:putative reverse transcriptase domain-containing protein [Tanacetum cinerariifolium]
MTRNYRNKGPATGSNLLPMIVTCHACGEKGHYANQCQKITNNNAQGRSCMLRDRNAHRDLNVVTGMFLLNQHLARVLYDSRADKSFISISLASMLNIPPTIIDTFYNIEMADRNLVSTNIVIQGCTLTLLNQPFKIDIMPIKLGSFDIVIGMDWLSKYHAKIICDEKVVHIPIDGETLIIRGDQIKEFLDVFPKDLLGLPPVRQVEFQIDLIPGAALVARAPYRLAPSKMQELFDQLQELADRGLAGYYQRFIKDFSKITKSLTELTQKNKKYIWGEDQETAFQLFKQKLYEAPILALPKGNDDLIVYCDASHQGLGAVFMQREKPKLRQLKKKTSRPRTYEEWTKHLKYVLMEIVVLRIEVGYNSLAAPFEALYGRKCRSPVCWAEVGDVQLTGPEIIHETTEKIVQIQQRLQATRDRQRSYANVRRNPLKFQVRDHVMLKVSPRKGVIRFRKQGKLNPWYIGPFKILERIGPMAYKLEIYKELSNVHSTFHISNLKKCLSDESLVIPMKELRLDDKLKFVEEPVEVIDQEIKQLKQSRIPIVKLRCNSKRGPELTWERKDQIRAKYPHLFSNITPASN